MHQDCGARRNVCVAELLEGGNTTGVVKVDVAVKNEPDIFHPKPKGSDVGRNLWRTLLHRAINKNVALW